MERADNFKKVLIALFGSSIPDLPVPDDSASGDETDNEPSEGSNSPGNSSGSSDTSSGGNSSGSETPCSAWYPDYNPIWADGKCINLGEPPSGRPNYPSLEECCSKSYGGQASGVCLGTVQDSPPGGTGETETTSTSSTGSVASTVPQDESSPNSPNSDPTNDETSPNNNDSSSEPSSTAYWPDYNPIWSLGKCVSDGEPPSGRPNYPSIEECCNNAYGGQASRVCVGAAEGSTPEPSALNENDESTGDMWYPDYNSLWSRGKCTNALPFENGRPSYSTQMECCQNAYRGQASGVCLADIPDQPSSVSDAVENSLEMWYGDYNPIWAEGKCIKPHQYPTIDRGITVSPSVAKKHTVAKPPEFALKALKFFQSKLKDHLLMLSLHSSNLNDSVNCSSIHVMLMKFPQPLYPLT
jgi:hypothetical protein